MIDCGQPFYITPAEVDELEFSGMTGDFIRDLNPSAEQAKVIKAKKESGSLNVMGLQIKDLMDIYDKCLEGKEK